jgi:ketosteroid isomerase-like protein
MNTIQEKIQHQIAQIQAGNVLGAFEELYADDVVMRESQGEPRVGKAINRAHEEGFVNAVAAWHKADVKSVQVNEAAQTSTVEWAFEFTFKDAAQPTQMNQVAVQRWRDGRIVEEHFYAAN